jgi:orotidine-5'-phosphate decarboxylase
VSFADRLGDAVLRTGTALCVGIDPWPERLPGRAALGPSPSLDALADRARVFGFAVVDACAGRVGCVKPQFAFFEALGVPGMAALAAVCERARDAGLLVIGDAKRGDIGSTAAAYAAATLAPGAPFPCDALTVSPFLGPDTLEPFVRACDAHGRGLFVLLRTSNRDSARWQAPVAGDLSDWIEGASADRRGAHGLGPIGAVVGGTHEGALVEARARLPSSWILVPGFGAQGASPASCRSAALPSGLGAVVASARGATFPAGPDPSFDRDPAWWIAGRVTEVVAELGWGVDV